MRPSVIALVVLTFGAAPLRGQRSDSGSLPEPQQYDLSTDGQAFLLGEAANASFFMLGELHGENEIPSLIRGLWPSMWKAGYRHVAAEISPWAADRLESGKSEPPIMGLWRASEATLVTSLKTDRSRVLWGCDIEEIQPQWLIRDLAAANPEDRHLQAAVDAVGNIYRRRTAPILLQHLQSATVAKDLIIDNVSLRSHLIRTLEVEADRSAGATLPASIRRERVMKDLFHDYWLTATGKPKVFLRFGRNHLHRGYDRRGVSTLGNFVAELAVAEHLQVFNVAAFAGGGRIALIGPPTDFDERGDDPAFGYLASIARYPATVFDLRPMRQALHRLPEGKRSALQTSLVYWVDGYDAMLFYREVTPLGH